jgi:hypothetical protein
MKLPFYLLSSLPHPGCPAVPRLSRICCRLRPSHGHCYVGLPGEVAFNHLTTKIRVIMMYWCSASANKISCCRDRDNKKWAEVGREIKPKIFFPYTQITFCRTGLSSSKSQGLIRPDTRETKMVERTGLIRRRRKR